MIHKNKLQAIFFILPGFLGFFAARILADSIPAQADIFQVLSATSYLLYLWGSYNLTVGKGYSKWYMLLFLVPFFPTVIVMLLLRDRNKDAEKQQESRISKIVLYLTSFFCVWFGVILCLHIGIKIFVIPTLNHIKTTYHELRLPSQHEVSDSGISISDLKMGQIAEGTEMICAVPLFNNHEVKGINLVLYNGDEHAGNILIRTVADDLKVNDEMHGAINKYLYFCLFFNSSRSELYKRVYLAQPEDFSAWNLVKDIRVFYCLIEKAIRLPFYLKGGKVCQFTTNNVEGILTFGQDGKKTFVDMYFTKNNVFYDVVVVAKCPLDIHSFLRSVSVIDSKGRSADSRRDVELVTNLARKVTLDDLEESLKLVEQKIAAGYKIKDQDLRAEAQYQRSKTSRGTP